MSPLRESTGRKHAVARRGSESAKRAADRRTVLNLLRACIVNEIRCVAEVVCHSSSDPVASRALLEDLLAMKDAHARDLIDVLQHHHVGLHPEAR